jgi:hypothetical protein
LIIEQIFLPVDSIWVGKGFDYCLVKTSSYPKTINFSNVENSSILGEEVVTNAKNKT